jgi:ELWxxDGT repeat protein
MSDGTPAGTVKVPNVLPAVPGYTPLYPFDRMLGVPGGPLVFAGGDDTGCELWTLDGNAATPARVADLRVGPASSVPHGWVVLGERVLFTADDGDGGQLWSLGVERDGGPTWGGTGGGSGAGGSGGTGGGSGTAGGSSTGGSGSTGGSSGAGGGTSATGGGTSTGVGCHCATSPALLLFAAAFMFRRRRR